MKLSRYHYRPTVTNYLLIPIDKIIIDKSIIDAVKRYNGSVPKGILVSKEFSSPLNRMEPLKDSFGNILVPSVLEALYNKIPLPPIILKKYGETGHYTIIEGRHRIASSIILGYPYIPANIV